MESQKIWAGALSEIKELLSASSFKTWFGGASLLEHKKEDGGDLLVVGVRNNFIKEQLQTKFLNTIETAVKKRGIENPKLVFVVSKQESRSLSDPLFSGQNQTLIVKRRNDVLNISYTFENFAVGPSNNIAYIAAGQVASNPGTSYNPLLIYGPTGVGKTHLAQAVGNDVSQKAIGAKVLYVSAEKFTNDYIESLRNHTQGAFREKYRSCDLLIVDDIHFFAGKESTQDEFFNTFNELFLSNKQLVLVSDKHPKHLGKIKERLISRFLGGFCVDVAFPDFELRCAILTMKCKQKGVTLAEDLVREIASSADGGARELEGMLVSVLSVIRLGGGKISASEIQKHIVRDSSVLWGPALTPEKILSVVSKYFGVTLNQIKSQSRKLGVSYARQVAMYLLRKHLAISLVEIGGCCGGRDHATVIHSIDKIEALVSGGGQGLDEILRIEKSL